MRKHQSGSVPQNHKKNNPAAELRPQKNTAGYKEQRHMRLHTPFVSVRRSAPSLSLRKTHACAQRWVHAVLAVRLLQVNEQKGLGVSRFGTLFVCDLTMAKLIHAAS